MTNSKGNIKVRNRRRKFKSVLPLHKSDVMISTEAVATQKFVKAGIHLPVKNLRQTLDFYRDKLGFTDEWMQGEKDGGIRRDDLRLLFAEDPAFAADINTGRHRLPILWFVQGIETVFSEFAHKGIEFADTLRKHPYGLNEFAFVDINGYYIRVAEPV